MHKLLLIALLLVGCVPVIPVDPRDPTPIVPEPVEDTLLFSGNWSGSFNFSDTDGFGNEEFQIVGASIIAVYYDEGNISGDLQFFTNDDVCALEGTQVVTFVEIRVVCIDFLAFSLSGEIDSGSWSGDYEVLDDNIVLRPGKFIFSYTGVQ